MTDYSKIFNPKKSSFYLADNDSADLLKDGGKNITKAYLAGFKAKDFAELPELFPNLKSLTILKNNKLSSLDGLQKFNLQKLSLEHSIALTDYSQLATQKSLKEFITYSAPVGTQILVYLVMNLTHLSIDPNDPKFDLISKMTELKSLSLSCDQCDRKTFPLLPAALESLTIEGNYPNLKDASFMNNLQSKIKLNLWFDFTGLKNIPKALKDNGAFA